MALSPTLPVIEWGQGEAIVFLHYFGGAAASWRWVAEQLQTTHRCIAVDLPGFGTAPALDHPSIQAYGAAVARTLAALNVQNYTLVGHSMGGKIALQIAADSEGNGLQQVILIAPSPPTQEPMPAEEKQRMLENHPSRDNAATTLDSATRKSLTAEQRSLAIATHVAPDDRTWRWWLLEGMNHAIADQMHRVTVPVTVLASHDDPVIPHDTVITDVIGRVPGAQQVSVQGLGHLMPLEDPDFVAGQIWQVLSNL
ncbi:alpha/beta hydrolase [filamentous cyanobacterium CCP5]|nr:alpha/beta hydrolase [filamentous cyanobacterium CCP5]